MAWAVHNKDGKKVSPHFEYPAQGHKFIEKYYGGSSTFTVKKVEEEKKMDKNLTEYACWKKEMKEGTKPKKERVEMASGGTSGPYAGSGYSPAAAGNLFSAAKRMGEQRGKGMRNIPGGPVNGAVTPAAPTAPMTPTAPTMGTTPMGNNKGPLKQVGDNVQNNMNRTIQRDYGTGPTNQKGVNTMLGKAGFGNKGGSFMAGVKRFFGFQDEYPIIGQGIETASLFEKTGKQEVKQDKVETASNKSGIHIKESKEGTFTAAATKAGYKNVQQFASHVLANKDKYSPAMVKKANFARNASKWKH